MSFKFNPIYGTLDLVGKSTSTPAGDVVIQEYLTDPVSPTPETAWVLHDVRVAGSPIGLLLSLTQAEDSSKYKFSFKTLEGPIVRVELT